MTRIFAYLSAFARRDEVTGIAVSMLVKALSILSSFLLFSLGARVLGEEAFGQFALFFSAASMVAVAAVFGQEMLIIRVWNENVTAGRLDLAKGGIVFGFLVSAAGAGLGGAAMALVVGLVDTWAAAASTGLFVIVAVFLLFFSSLTRTIVSILMGDGQREITAFAPPNIVLAICLALGMTLSPIWVVNLLTVGMVSALAVQLFYLIKTLRRMHPDIFASALEYAPDRWMPASIRLWGASILETSNQYLDVILIGFLLDPVAAGAYFVTSRLANGFASVADAFNMFAMRQFPELYYKRDQAGLLRMLHTLAILIALAVVCGLMIVGLAGQWLLLIFGAEYMAYYHVLVLLCLGSAAMAATGPAAPVLMVTGHEGQYLRIVALSVFIRATGFLVIVPFYGIVGAAAATMVSLLVMAVLVSVKSQAATGLNVTATRICATRTLERIDAGDTRT